MTKYAKVAISLPPEDLAVADDLAARLDRPRSWVIAQAIKQLGAAYANSRSLDELDPSRSLQLARDLALTPEERVRASDAITHVGPASKPSTVQPLRFATYDEFAQWRRENPDGELPRDETSGTR